MISLGLAILVFLASHSLFARPSIRRRAEAALGRVGFTLAYSALSLALLTWVVVAARQAPVEILWDQAPWTRWVPPVAMLPASVLLAGALLTPNPFSIGPGGRGFDPAHPGLLRLTRHPALWGLALWAGAHLVPNGQLALVLLFLPLLLLALAGPRLLDRRRRLSLGAAEWTRLAVLTGHPREWRAALAEMGWKRLAAGPPLYVALIALHPWVIGFSPLP